ncbi:hypothetical protein [Mesorhizobium sp. GbtcB19]|uniref:hypothetical protein n=1 Tax=Mesorhizobium sp. GbtcB19 TaxID=2824764 RepID=UPI001C2F3FC0|nr:hypothetical protein [Mesorhizobium sp. GbtcB19]
MSDTRLFWLLRPHGRLTIDVSAKARGKSYQLCLFFGTEQDEYADQVKRFDATKTTIGVWLYHFAKKSDIYQADIPKYHFMVFRDHCCGNIEIEEAIKISDKIQDFLLDILIPIKELNAGVSSAMYNYIMKVCDDSEETCDGSNWRRFDVCIVGDLGEFNDEGDEGDEVDEEDERDEEGDQD